MQSLYAVSTSPTCRLCGSEKAYWIKDRRGLPVLSLCPDCAAHIAAVFLGTEPSMPCPYYRNARVEKKSWIYNEPPKYCGTCAEYEPDLGRCRRFPGKIECVCSHCGNLILDAPNRYCSECGSKLLPITTSSDWQ